MNNTEPTQEGIVIEAYDHDRNQVVTAYGPTPGHYQFFYLPPHPAINFGDTILMNFNNQKLFVHHGNPHLTYRISPIVFPGTLLYELITERIQEDQK